MLLNTENNRSFFVTKSFENEERWNVAVERLPELGSYSSEKKAIKVLDMIQDAYISSKLTELLVPEIGKVFKEAPLTKENELLSKTTGKIVTNRMIFQMPVDEEVPE